MNALRLYIDNENNDLWIFFSDSASSHIGGPFLYCFDSRTMRFKKEIRLYSTKGTPVTSPFDPLFVTHDQKGNFILANDMAYLTKVNEQGSRIYRKRLMEYYFHWTARNQKRRRPYFVMDIQKQGDHQHKGYGRGFVRSLYMLSMAFSKSRDLIFVGQHCSCDPNDVIVYNGDGKYLYHFGLPAGPSAMAARDGLLYLADHYQSYVHVYTYEGQWVRSSDMLFKDRFDGLYYLKNGQLERRWNIEGQYVAEDKFCIVSMCVLGEDKLAVGMEGGLVRVLNDEGHLICDIQPPKEGLYPISMAGYSSANHFVYYTADGFFSKPHGLYRYDANGHIRGPLFKGKLGMFTPKEKDLGKRIAEDSADAYDYFDLADILIRRKKLSQETIGLLEKSLELKPDLWIALAYLGLTLNKLGEIERAVACMEKAMEHMCCSNMATALMEYYYRKHNKEKVWQYFQRMEALEDDVDVEFYSEELTNEQIEQMLGALVKRNKSDNLVSN